MKSVTHDREVIIDLIISSLPMVDNDTLAKIFNLACDARAEYKGDDIFKIIFFPAPSIF